MADSIISPATHAPLNDIYKYVITMSGFKICRFSRSTEAEETAESGCSTSCRRWRPSSRLKICFFFFFFLSHCSRWRWAPVTFVVSPGGRLDHGGVGVRCGSGSRQWGWRVREASCPPRPVWGTQSRRQSRADGCSFMLIQSRLGDKGRRKPG